MFDSGLNYKYSNKICASAEFIAEFWQNATI
jgi:hypothetical protein